MFACLHPESDEHRNRYTSLYVTQLNPIKNNDITAMSPVLRPQNITVASCNSDMSRKCVKNTFPLLLFLILVKSPLIK
jgi:hypothetical protein